MLPSDLCLVNEDGEVVGGNMHSCNPAGYVIHSAVHKARPDIVGVVHCHSVPSKAFSSLGCKLEPINQDACRFYGKHSICGFGGIALEKKAEGEHIAEALGAEGKAVILQNHGHLTAARTVDGAVFLFGAFDRCIQAQLMADAALAGRVAAELDGGRVLVDDETARYTEAIYNDEMLWIMQQSAFEDVVRASDGKLSWGVEGEIQRPAMEV
jgi:ribulose-5-phosphate 4-epimerase/fuculose-1-phosphate aldolase